MRYNFHMSTGGLTLNVLVFEDAPGRWVAQVLEKDMTAHGPNEYAALAAVQLVLQAHVNFDTRHNKTPLSRLKPAPDVYWRAYRTAKPLPIPPNEMAPAHIEAHVTHERLSRTA